MRVRASATSALTNCVRPSLGFGFGARFFLEVERGNGQVRIVYYSALIRMNTLATKALAAGSICAWEPMVSPAGRPSPPRCAVAGVTLTLSQYALRRPIFTSEQPFAPQPQRISKQQMIESFQRDLSSFIHCREGHERPQARAWPRDTSGSDILIWYQQDVNVFKSPIAKFVFEYVPHRGKAGSVSLTRAFALF